MSLSVADALRDGLGRTFERSGLQLVAVFLAVRLVSAVATNTLNRANLTLAEELGALPSDFAASPFAGLADAPTPFALGIGLAGAWVLFVAVALAAEAARIVAVRTMAAEDPTAIPVDARRGLGTATVNGFVGGLIVYTLTTLGLVVLVVPGLFLAMAFFFVRQEIALRDVNFVEAMGGSWERSAGNRLELFGLAVAIFLVGVAGSVPGFVLSAASPAASALVSAVIRAFVVVFAIASVTRAYVQLREDDDGADEPEPDPYEGALGPDDLPEPDAENAP
ncbi:MAG: hypothetical protein ABEJ92_08275 [Halobacteriales archaeon]